jgi:hypothetical protein
MGMGARYLMGDAKALKKKNGEIDIPHPNLIEQQESLYQIDVLP